MTVEAAATGLGTAADITTHISSVLLRASPTLIRLTEAVEALDGLEWPEHNGQEQLCDPLVPACTYWYLSAAPELLALAAERRERNLAVRP
jgi:hypothetical protein